MIKQKYDTNFGAIWNLISNRNYTKPLLYKSLYLLYYFITITVVLELLFNKTYIILAVISSIIIVINGRKYDDPEHQFIEYLPISLKDKVRYIYYTTYITLFFGGIISFVLDYIYRKVNPIEYLYAIIVVIALSNFAVIQMIKTKITLIYFFIYDIIIYQFIVGIFRFSLVSIFSGYIGPKYDNTQFDLIKLALLIVITLLYYFVSVNILLAHNRENKRVDKKYKGKLVLILFLLISTSVLKIYTFEANMFFEGIKEGTKDATRVELINTYNETK